MKAGFVGSGLLLTAMSLLLLWLAVREVRDSGNRQWARIAMVALTSLVTATAGGAIIAYGVTGA